MSAGPRGQYNSDRRRVAVCFGPSAAKPRANQAVYQGYYINLAQNTTRRDALRSHLAQLGVADRYQRVEAVDGRAVAERYPSKLDPGNLGLFLTHAELLKAALPANRHLHVIEDDAILAATAVAHFDQMLEHADRELGDWDLIFTDVDVSAADLGLYHQLSGALKRWRETGNYGLLDLKSIAFSGTSSLFINGRSLARYADVMRDGWSQELAIDLYLRSAVHQGRLKAYLIVPFVTSISPAALESDIRGPLDQSRAVGTIYRRAFFQDADLTALDAELEQLVRDVEFSTLDSIYARALLFQLSDRWKAY